MEPTGRGVEARVHDLDALLEGAPPLQISRLSSSLSHEIRNPLSSVKMAVQTLARNTASRPRDQRRLTIANREIRTHGANALAALRVRPRHAARVDSCSLPDLVQEAGGLMEPELAERSIRLESSEVEGLPRVRADGIAPAAGAGPAAAQRGLEPRGGSSRCS